MTSSPVPGERSPVEPQGLDVPGGGKDPNAVAIEELRAKLLAECTRGAIDEQLAVCMAADAVQAYVPLQRAESRLARLLQEIALDAQKAKCVAGTLKVVVDLSSALARRAQSSLEVAAGLRAQRHLAKGPPR